jgi:hypothetical protein
VTFTFTFITNNTENAANSKILVYFVDSVDVFKQKAYFDRPTDRPTAITLTLGPVRCTSSAKFISSLLVFCVVANSFLNTFGCFAGAEHRQECSVINLFPDLNCLFRNAFLITPKRSTAIPRIPNKLLFTTHAGIEM